MEDKEKEKCGGCGRDERRLLLHNVVRQRAAAYRRLCTDCVLKNHLGHFCAFCYHVYDDSEEEEEEEHEDEGDSDSDSHHRHKDDDIKESKVMCLKCPAVSHPSCVPLSHPHAPPSFLCPPCSHNNNNNNNSNNSFPFSFFRPRPLNPSQQHRALDQDSARALVAAAKIAAASMSKAAALARLEAERRVKEAALAKKRAREALDKLAYLAASSHHHHNNSANAAIGNKRPRETAASHLQSRNGNGNGAHPAAPPNNTASVDK